jgi:hypothetical protein
MAALRGEALRDVPLLLRHRPCPGFTGPPLGERAWLRLYLRTARLQFPREEG